MRPARRRLSVLVAGGCPTLRSALEAALSGERDHWISAEATSGAAVIRRLLDHAPDLVLLDAVLPDMNGFDLLRRLRQAVPHCTVVMLGGSQDPMLRELSLELGAATFCHRVHGLAEILAIARVIAGRVHERPGSLGYAHPPGVPFFPKPARSNGTEESTDANDR